jgi:hypothetical protein
MPDMSREGNGITEHVHNEETGHKEEETGSGERETDDK